MTQLQDTTDNTDWCKYQYLWDEYKRLCELGRNPATPASELAELSTHVLDDIRASVAMNPAVPSEILKTLSEDRHSWVRLCVAEHPAADEETLALLTFDKNLEVREAAQRKLTEKKKHEVHS